MWRDYVSVVLPVLVAALSTMLAEWLQRFITWIDRWAPIWKRLLVISLTFWLAKASAFLGVTIGASDITDLTATDLGALSSAALAYLFHLSRKP